MEEAEEKSTMTLELARSKAETIEKDAQALAKKKKEKILADAEREATSMLASGRADIEKERLSMINSMKSRIISLSLRLNEKLFSREKTNKDFMEKELNSII
jgi:F0F1-type ATP synthase membrane subunit b/b'